MLKLRTDCKHFIGEKPCGYGRLCDGCEHYEAWTKQILIIKTGAMGDVLRTTTLLPAIERGYPGARVTWMASEQSAPLLENHPVIREIVTLNGPGIASVQARRFDLVLSLDKTSAECGLAMLLDAEVKKGIGLSNSGTPFPLDADAEYYFELGVSDELKFRRNDKTYHELVREVCGLDAKHDPPRIYLAEQEKESARALVDKALTGRNAKRVGIIPGAGKAFANKTPAPEKWAKLISLLRESPGETPEIFLMGGPDDAEQLDALKGLSAATVIKEKSVRLFAGCVALMDAIVCGDTLALHVASALDVWTAAIFGPTCAGEIDLFGRGEKFITRIDCAPCYRGNCRESPDCMDSIDTREIARAVNARLDSV